MEEIDELIEEWTPEPLIEPPTELEQSYVNKIPVISGYNQNESLDDKLMIAQPDPRRNYRMAGQ